MNDCHHDPQAKQRYDVEAVAQFVENCLRDRSPEEQAKWAGLPAKIRAYPYPFIYAAPDARIVDCVRFVAPEIDPHLTNN